MWSLQEYVTCILFFGPARVSRAISHLERYIIFVLSFPRASCIRTPSYGWGGEEESNRSAANVYRYVVQSSHSDSLCAQTRAPLGGEGERKIEERDDWEPLVGGQLRSASASAAGCAGTRSHIHTYVVREVRLHARTHTRATSISSYTSLFFPSLYFHASFLFFFNRPRSLFFLLSFCPASCYLSWHVIFFWKT